MKFNTMQRGEQSDLRFQKQLKSVSGIIVYLPYALNEGN
jgi:hypothetical protein